MSVLKCNVFNSNDLSSFPSILDQPMKMLVDEKRRILDEIASQACQDFAWGRCKGTQCKLRHVRGMKDGQSCKHYMRGLCKKGDECEFLHIYDMSKMPECQFFRDHGLCGNSNDCVFLHITPESKIRECYRYKKGHCNKGPSCPNTHTRLEMCPRYLAGFCYLGPVCPKAHPRFTLDQSHESHSNHSHRRNKDNKFGKPDDESGRELPNDHSSRGYQDNQNRPNLANITCFKCKQMGHFANNCPNQHVRGNIPNNQNNNYQQRNQQRGQNSYQQQQNSSTYNNHQNTFSQNRPNNSNEPQHQYQNNRFSR